MTEAGSPCVVCGSVAQRRARVRLRYGTIFECAGCGTGLLEPRPTAAGLSALHSEEAYFSHPYFEDRRELTAAMRASSEAKLSRIEARVGSLAGKTLVDVGCDLGVLGAYATESRGMTAIGIDIIAKVVEIGRAAGRDLRHGTLESVALPSGSADLICGFDLIEHVDDPRGLAREAWRVLKPGGVLALETPNYNGLVYRIGRWLGGAPGLASVIAGLQERLWPPFHVQYFTADSLRNVLDGAGFADVKVQGRELDTSELAVSSPVLRAAVLSVFAAARVTGSATLLTAIARKPRQR
ncbi:MAG TPA: class I SAM-dependent methyltransferase [Beijerinckiaceae bacterium]|nr:class I SAM-dependent methyltransferase [Beijerinckiaceae bacterium]